MIRAVNVFTKLMLMVLLGLSLTVQAYAFAPNFKRAQISTSSHREMVVLIHGLMRTSFSMRPLKSYLERNGYQVYIYSYSSAKYTIQQHGSSLEQFIKNLLVENPGVKINFITHSLGGIITREAVAKLTPTQLHRIGCLIMLAPPNQGSVLAKLSTKMFPLITSSIKPLAELSSDQDAYVHHVPVPPIKMGIIAGRFDAKVPPSAARLEGQPEPVIINTTHTFIMNSSKTKELVLSFLKNGTFGTHN